MPTDLGMYKEFKDKDAHQALSKEIMMITFIFNETILNKHVGIRIVLLFIDRICFLGERLSPWASCLTLK